MVQASAFTPDEDQKLINLKENSELTWFEIAKHFPNRSKGSLQVHYSRTLFKKGRKRAEAATTRLQSAIKDSSVSTAATYLDMKGSSKKAKIKEQAVVLKAEKREPRPTRVVASGEREQHPAILDRSTNWKPILPLSEQEAIDRGAPRAFARPPKTHVIEYNIRTRSHRIRRVREGEEHPYRDMFAAVQKRKEMKKAAAEHDTIGIFTKQTTQKLVVGFADDERVQSEAKHDGEMAGLSKPEEKMSPSKISTQPSPAAGLKRAISPLEEPVDSIVKRVKRARLDESLSPEKDYDNDDDVQGYSRGGQIPDSDEKESDADSSEHGSDDKDFTPDDSE